MEDAQPSKHLTTPGSDDGRGTIRHGVGVDDKWEHQRVHQDPQRR